MLIGNILEKTPAEAAWQLSADKLADWVRTSWQNNTKFGMTAWEETAHEDPLALPGLREEGFSNLVGLDYILKWWGAKDPDDLAGELDVIWKTMNGDNVVCYKTWIKLADRDLVLGLQNGESAKRDANRATFRDAFVQWKDLFADLA